MGRTIRELRAVTGETQAQLARAIGCSSPQLAQWEAGTAPIPAHRKEALAEHFGVPVDDIVSTVTAPAPTAGGGKGRRRRRGTPRTIRELRDDAGVSQAQLARMLDIRSSAQLASWESNTAPLPAHWWQRLAEHFGVHPDDIIAPLTKREEAEQRIVELEAEVTMLTERLSRLEAELERRGRRPGQPRPG